MDGINFTVLFAIIGILVGITNIITQVLKQLTWDKMPTNLVAILVSQGLSFAAFFAYISYSEIAFRWYYIAGVIVVGFMVSYAAMFGFDKLREIINDWPTTKNKGGDDNGE